MDALADDVIADGDVGEALRRLLERGWQLKDPGRADLRRPVGAPVSASERRRDELLDRYRLGDVLGDVRAELGQIVEAERAGIDRRLASVDADGGAPSEELGGLLRDTIARRLDRLDALPDDLGDRIRALRSTTSWTPAARERFEELVERLRRSGPRPLRRGHVRRDPGHDARRTWLPTGQMVRDLNQLLQRAARRARSPIHPSSCADTARFFPGAQTLDDIIEPAGRADGGDAVAPAVDDRRRSGPSCSRMMDAPAARRPPALGPGPAGRDPRPAPARAGWASASASAVTSSWASRARSTSSTRLQADRRRLEADLGAVEAPLDLGSDRSRELAERCSATDAARDLDALDDLAATPRGGAATSTRDGDRLELTPRGSRRIGQKVLDDLFARLRRDAFGGHRLDRAGRGGERERDDQAVRVRRPVRPRPARARSPTPCGRRGERPGRRAPGRRGIAASAPADFEVYRTEELDPRPSTVLLVDMSRSMLLRGCFLAAKKVAVALDTLIRTQYPRDDLHVIGFAYYAREIRAGRLAELSWHGYEYGTNLQHGLLLARRILARRHAGEPRDRRHHRRRADRPLRGRPGRVQLPADAADDRGDAARGSALHAGRHHDQHVHARAIPGAGRVRRPYHPAQPRPGLLRRARAPRASTSWSTSSAAAPASAAADPPAVPPTTD